MTARGLFESVDRTPGGRPFDDQACTAVLIVEESVAGQGGDLLHAQDVIYQAYGALPIFTGDLECVAIRANVNRARTRKHALFGEKVGVDILSGKFRPSPAILGG